MRTTSGCALALAGLLATTPALAEGVYGVWKTESNRDGAYLHVEIGDCGDKLCGTITKTVNSENQEIVGRKIIEEMNADGPNKWDDGTIWKPDTDEVYDSEMTLEGQVLKVSGCVLAGMVCKSQDWTRVE